VILFPLSDWDVSLPGPVGERPEGDRTGQRHDALAIVRDPQIAAPCGKVLHREDAFLVGMFLDVGFSASPTGQALSCRHAGPTAS
jgi:hypothetical protein